jgi:hypothetical protein
MFSNDSDADLSSDDRSTLDPHYNPSSSVTESTMSGTLYTGKLDQTYWMLFLDPNFDITLEDANNNYLNDEPFLDDSAGFLIDVDLSEGRFVEEDTQDYSLRHWSARENFKL